MSRGQIVTSRVQLVLNAGIGVHQFALTGEGIDRHFCVNWLSQYYAINLLYPLLRKTASLPGAPAVRIIMESSEAHHISPSSVNFASLDEINDPSLGPFELYARSKLAMILGVKYGIYEKVIKPNHDNAYAIAVHPGTVSNSLTFQLLLKRYALGSRSIQVNTAMQRKFKEAYPGLIGRVVTDVSILASRSPEQGAYPTW